MMGAPSGSASLPPPCPKSPPVYPDLYGKRRELAKVQMLEREIGFLEEEVKSAEDLPPASKCCKEVADFVVANSDPLIPTNRKIHKRCRFWKWLCGMPCISLSWLCCCMRCCSLRLEKPHCSFCCSCHGCSPPKWRCCCNLSRSSSCCRPRNTLCGGKTCCAFPRVSCPCKCSWVCLCPKVPCCSNCTKTSCNPCCLCY